MSDIDKKLLYRTIRRYAVMMGGITEEAELVEVCDFSDSIGFLFESDDVYSNCYWCINKRTYKPSSFRPNEDIKKYMKRKVIDKDVVER